jgi:hypothetical protein
MKSNHLEYSRRQENNTKLYLRKLDCEYVNILKWQDIVPRN